MLNRSVIDAQLVELIGGWRCVSGWPSDLIPLQEQPVMSKDRLAIARPKPPPKGRASGSAFSTSGTPGIHVVLVVLIPCNRTSHTHTQPPVHNFQNTMGPHNVTSQVQVAVRDPQNATSNKGPPVPSSS